MTARKRTLAIRVTEGQYDAYAERAAEAGCHSVSEWARHMLDTAAGHTDGNQPDVNVLDAAKAKLARALED